MEVDADEHRRKHVLSIAAMANCSLASGLRVFDRAAGSFYNQRLRAWHPILTPTWVIVAFLAVAAAFIPTGIILKAASDDVSHD